MRNIKQMTYEELNKLINQVKKDRFNYLDKDAIKYNELMNLSFRLEEEASRRAKAIGTNRTAERDYNIAI